MTALAEDGDRVWLTFDALCAGRTSVADMLELSERYSTLVLSAVPPLSDVSPDARRRFADLVDVLWDRDVRLIVLSEGCPDRILTGDFLDKARTLSRLSLLRVA